MTTSKLLDNNRRTHAAKVLAEASKKNQVHEENIAEQTETTVAHEDTISSLNDQYQVIREDILKLREDLAHGYDLIKEYIEEKMSIKSLLKLKS